MQGSSPQPLADVDSASSCILNEITCYLFKPFDCGCANEEEAFLKHYLFNLIDDVLAYPYITSLLTDVEIQNLRAFTGCLTCPTVVLNPNTPIIVGGCSCDNCSGGSGGGGSQNITESFEYIGYVAALQTDTYDLSSFAYPDEFWFIIDDKVWSVGTVADQAALVTAIAAMEMGEASVDGTTLTMSGHHAYGRLFQLQVGGGSDPVEGTLNFIGTGENLTPELHGGEGDLMQVRDERTYDDPSTGTYYANLVLCGFNILSRGHGQWSRHYFIPSGDPHAFNFDVANPWGGNFPTADGIGINPSVWPKDFGQELSDLSVQLGIKLWDTLVPRYTYSDMKGIADYPYANGADVFGTADGREQWNGGAEGNAWLLPNDATYGTIFFTKMNTDLATYAAARPSTPLYHLLPPYRKILLSYFYSNTTGLPVTGCTMNILDSDIFTPEFAGYPIWRTQLLSMFDIGMANMLTALNGVTGYTRMFCTGYGTEEVYRRTFTGYCSVALINMALAVNNAQGGVITIDGALYYRIRDLNLNLTNPAPIFQLIKLLGELYQFAKDGDAEVFTIETNSTFVRGLGAKKAGVMKAFFVNSGDSDLELTVTEEGSPVTPTLHGTQWLSLDDAAHGADFTGGTILPKYSFTIADWNS